jgi:transcriptional regulator with XRE-family HTH domain
VILTLKLVRVASGLTLTAFEALTRVNATDLSRIERGKLIPSAAQVEKLASALNISADELLKPVALQDLVTVQEPRQAEASP